MDYVLIPKPNLSNRDMFFRRFGSIYNRYDRSCRSSCYRPFDGSLVHSTEHTRGDSQTCQPSRFWRDSPAFLPDVPRPTKSWKCPAFCTKSDFAEIPFDFSQKYQTLPRPNRRATVYFATQLISVCCILLKKIVMWALPTVPLFADKSRFFTRNVPLKTVSRLAGLDSVSR